MKIKNAFFLVVLFVMCFTSCSSDKQKTIEQYSAHSVKFKKEEVKEPNGNYYLIIPENWDFIPNEINDNTILSTTITENHKNRIEIYKARSDKDLKELNESIVNSIETLVSLVDKDVKVVEYGQTDILKYPSYFIHTSRDSNSEQFSFIFKSKQEEFYYRLIVVGEKQNIPMMLQCLKSFEILK